MWRIIVLKCVSAAQQCESALSIHAPRPWSLSPHIWALQGIPDHGGTEQLASHSRFPAVIYLTHASVYMALLSCPFAPSSPSFYVSTSLLSIPQSIFLPCKYAHHTIFLDFIYMHYICYFFLFSSWFTSLCVAGSRFIHLTLTGSNSFHFVEVFTLHSKQRF